MLDKNLAHHPDLIRFSGIYRLIPPEEFKRAGIDPDDVPLGTFPALDHPVFLPNRFGGNAYGLGLYEQAMLPGDDYKLLESINLEDPGQVAENYPQLNDIYKRLGLLIRYTKRGEIFYLIPRQYVAHYLTEVRAKVDEISLFLTGLMNRRLKESLKVGLACADSELLRPQLISRLPQLDFTVLDSLEAVIEAKGPFEALVLVGNPKNLAIRGREKEIPKGPKGRSIRESLGYFMGTRAYSLLEPEGELFCLCDKPQGSSREKVKVRFKEEEDLKRFLIFTHVYRTRRRYKCTEAPEFELNRFDINSYLVGMGMYHDSLESVLDGRRPAELKPGDIDELPYQEIPLPRGSAPQLVSGLRRWLEPFFEELRLESILPEAQRKQWENKIAMDGEPPQTLVLFQGRRRVPKAGLTNIAARRDRSHLAGCTRELLAGYKNSFGYVLKVLGVLNQVRDGSYLGLPGLELSRLRKPFETALRHEQLKHVLQLMDASPRLKILEKRLNPMGVLGKDTPVLENLEMLSLMGMGVGALAQLYLVVLGHSTMSRVTFGKLPATTLHELTDLGSHRNLEQALRVLRLYRLMSVAETDAASRQGLTRAQGRELFSLYDNAIRVLTEKNLDWDDVLAQRVAGQGGVQTMAVRKLLKLFDLFEFLDNWEDLEVAGPRQKEALADYDPRKMARIQEVVDLVSTLHGLVSRYYSGDHSARPYMFRVLLSCEMHGTGRLLPPLGAEAGVTLLWLCMHLNLKRLLNFNPLLKTSPGQELSHRLAKIGRALLGLGPDSLSPQKLGELRDELAGGRPVYLEDSGLYFRQNSHTGALEPGFVDPAHELSRMAKCLAKVEEVELSRAEPMVLEEIDQAAREVEQFSRSLGEREGPGRLRNKFGLLMGRIRNYLVRELLNLDSFGENLAVITGHMPNLCAGLLPSQASPKGERLRLAAAQKLTALHRRRLEGFQDMMLSHEMARAEFGPTADGILGVSPLQFQMLTASLSQLLEQQPVLGRLLMLAVLLYAGGSAEQLHKAGEEHAAFLEAARLNREQAAQLGFLLENSPTPWRIISGQATLGGLQPLLDWGDPLLVEALFILAIVFAASRREGFLSEDLLERFFTLLRRARNLSLLSLSARDAMAADLTEHARKALAMDQYRDLQGSQAPSVGLRHLLESARLPESEQEKWQKRGRREAGVTRLFALRGLSMISALDVHLARAQVPVAFIYRLKGLRSVSLVHFQRDLYEAKRLYGGLEKLGRKAGEFMLARLSDPVRSRQVLEFHQAARLLTYRNQVKLLFLGLWAAENLSGVGKTFFTISFEPLARVIDRKFELINQALTRLEPEALCREPGLAQEMQKAREGLVVLAGQDGSSLMLDFLDLVRFDGKLAALGCSVDARELKNTYHEELRALKLTAYSTLEYQERLDRAFRKRLEELGNEMFQHIRREMGQCQSLPRLAEIFDRAWEDGLELPLSKDHQQGLRDLFDLNAERLRADFIEDVSRELKNVTNFQELDNLWGKVRAKILEQREYLGKDFELLVAERFDRLTWSLRVRGGSAAL